MILFDLCCVLFLFVLVLVCVIFVMLVLVQGLQILFELGEFVLVQVIGVFQVVIGNGLVVFYVVKCNVGYSGLYVLCYSSEGGSVWCELFKVDLFIEVDIMLLWLVLLEIVGKDIVVLIYVLLDLLLDDGSCVLVGVVCDQYGVVIGVCVQGELKMLYLQQWVCKVVWLGDVFMLKGCCVVVIELEVVSVEGVLVFGWIDDVCLDV